MTKDGYQLIKDGNQLIKKENISQNISITFCQGDLFNVCHVCHVCHVFGVFGLCLLGMIQNQL